MTYIHGVILLMVLFSNYTDFFLLIACHVNNLTSLAKPEAFTEDFLKAQGGEMRLET